MTTGVDPGTPRRERREEVKARLRDALQELAAGSPFPEIRVSDITEGAGLSRSAFYFYYDDKRSLLLEAVAETVKPLFDEANAKLTDGTGDLRLAIRDALDSHEKAWTQHPELVRITIEGSIHDEAVLAYWRGIVSDFIAAVTERVLADQRNGRISGEVDAAACAEFLVLATEGYLYRRLTEAPETAAGLDTLVPIWTRVLAA